MPKKVEVKNQKRVSVCLSKEQLAMVEKMAIKISKEEGKLVSISETIRRSVETCYPIVKQGVMI